MKTIDYINKIAELDIKNGGTGSDYAVAKLLGISAAAVSRYRNHNGAMDDKTAYIAAELLGIDPLLAIAEINAQRARREEDSGFWKMQIKKLSSCTASIFGLALTLPPLINELINIYYVK